MDQINTELQKISQEISQIRKQFAEYEIQKQFDGWIPRKKLKEFLNYGETQLSEFLKSNGLKVSQIGNRKFIKKESFLKLLEENTKKIS